jgi:hypothetical protein
MNLLVVLDQTRKERAVTTLAFTLAAQKDSLALGTKRFARPH